MMAMMMMMMMTNVMIQMQHKKLKSHRVKLKYVLVESGLPDGVPDFIIFV